jgi:hypothetical protein
MVDHATIDHTGITGTGGSITAADALVGSDVTMTNVNTYYDGPSIALTAGTFLIGGHVTVQNLSGGASSICAKLWNGTTVEASVEGTSSTNGHRIALAIPLRKVIVAGSETWKISCAGDGGGGSKILAASVTNGAGNNASGITAVQIA